MASGPQSKFFKPLTYFGLHLLTSTKLFPFHQIDISNSTSSLNQPPSDVNIQAINAWSAPPHPRPHNLIIFCGLHAYKCPTYIHSCVPTPGVYSILLGPHAPCFYHLSDFQLQSLPFICHICPPNITSL